MQNTEFETIKYVNIDNLKKLIENFHKEYQIATPECINSLFDETNSGDTSN